MKLRFLSILALSLTLLLLAEGSRGQTSKEPGQKEAEEEEGTLAPMAPLGGDPEFKTKKREQEKTEEPERAKRPDVFPEASTGQIVPMTIEALKEGGETLVNQQILLKVYFGSRGSLSARRYGLKGKFHNFSVRDRNLVVLSRLWIPEGKEEVLQGLRRGAQVTVLARVHDVTTLSAEPVLEVSDIKRGWLWKVEDFLPKEASPTPEAASPSEEGKEPPAAATPAPTEGTSPGGTEGGSPPSGGGESPPSEGQEEKGS